MKPEKKMEGLRYKLFYSSAMIGHYLFFVSNSVFSVKNRIRTDVCYKKWLGEDWEPSFEGAGI